MPSHASLAKRPRLSYTPSPLSIAAQSFAAEEELARQRFISQSKLKSSWEGIFAKYSQSFEGIADEIDQVTGEIVVDNGHVRGLAVNFTGMKNEAEWERDEIMEGGGGMGGKGATKKVRLWDGMRLARKRDSGEDDTTPIAVGCEACRFQDELDDSVCLSCFPQGSTPPTVAETTTTLTHLAHSGVSAASPTTSVSKSPRTSPTGGKGVLIAGTPSPQSEDFPSDDFILERLGSHGAAVVGFLTKARAQSVMSSPIPIYTRGDDTPSKSRTSYLRGGRIEVKISPRRAKSPSDTTAPPPAMGALSPGPVQNSESCIDQADIRTWTPTRVTAWMLTNGVLHGADDTDLARAIEKHQVSGAVITGSAASRSLTLDDLRDKLEIPSFSKRMQLWSGILKLKALAPSPLRRPQRQATSPLFNSVSASSIDLPATPADPWAPPPIQEDPFYSHIWRDEHPDGTPTKFPPRLGGPMFLKTETPDRDVATSAVKKGVKRKRGPLPGSTPEPVKVEDVEKGSSAENSGCVESSGVGTPAAKASAERSLEQGVLKSGGARTPRTRTPRTRTPRTGTPRTGTPRTRTPRTRTPAVKSPRTKTPAAKSPRTKTPATKAPRKGTPTKTPTTKPLTAETPAVTAITKTATTKIATTKTPTPKTPAKAPTAGAPIEKTPVANTPIAGTPAAKTPITKTPAAKTPITKTPATKTPTAKAPVAVAPAGKTPITKTPAKMIPMKTPAKTPAPKTPATAQHPQVSFTPGWTTSSNIQTEGHSRRSILLLGGDPESDSDDELSLPASTSLVFTRRATAVGAMVKDESNCEDNERDYDDDDDITVKEESDGSEDTEEEGEKKKKTQGHNCTGGFCFVCLSLDGSEDDLV